MKARGEGDVGEEMQGGRQQLLHYITAHPDMLKLTVAVRYAALREAGCLYIMTHIRLS